MHTNFAGMTSSQKMVWRRDVASAARDMAFVSRFLGTSDNSMIQKITELTKTEKGEQAIMFLVADLVDDGVVGDNEREGNEEEMKSYDQILSIDMISHGVKNKGKLADQKTVIRFREHGRDKLAYWLANRIDQLAFLTMSGISYAFQNNGAARSSSAFSTLSFAGDVLPPSTNRHVNWTGSALEAGNTGAITSSYLPNYKMIVDAVAYAKDHYVKPLNDGGKEYYIMFVKPGTLANLKTDADYQRAVVQGLPRNAKNPWFTGGTVTIDGAVLHEHRLVYSTLGATAGNKWGAGGNVDGTRTLLCGAQALGMIDLGAPDWVEKGFDYDSKQGINIDKIFGLLKPRYYSIYDKSDEDFGVLAIDHYI